MPNTTNTTFRGELFSICGGRLPLGDFTQVGFRSLSFSKTFSFSANPTLLRVLRVARIGRILRTFRVVRAARGLGWSVTLTTHGSPRWRKRTQETRHTPMENISTAVAAQAALANAKERPAQKKGAKGGRSEGGPRAAKTGKSQNDKCLP